MEKSLDFLIYGKTADAGNGSSWDVLAHSEPLAVTQGKYYHQLVPVAPFADGTPAFAVMRIDSDTVLLAWATPDATRFVRIANADVRALKGDLAALLDAVSQTERLPYLHDALIWTPPRRQTALAQSLACVDGNLDHLLQILTGALYPDGVVIQDFGNDLMTRMAFMQGLILLLPESLRYYLTFSSNAHNLPPHRPRIIFCDVEASTTRKRLHWGTWSLVMDTTQPGMSFIAHLRSLWTGDLEAFVVALGALDRIAWQLNVADAGLAQTLDEVAKRHALEETINNPDSAITSERILEVLQGDAALDAAITDQYLQRLLIVALEERNAVASVWLAQQMDEHPSVDARLGAMLDATITQQPDAVYAFVRATLAQGGSLTRWLPRLHRSARKGLEFVLESGDPASINSWLQLLAREPERYNMADILHEGITRALPLAYTDATLARDLLVRAIKREPTMLVHLLADPQFQAALPETVQQAVLAHDADAIEALAGHSRELFLLALAQATQAGRGAITPTMVEALWSLYTSRANFIVADPYQPITLIRRLIGRDRMTLPEGGLQALLGVILNEREDELFYEVAETLARDEALLQPLTDVLKISARPTDDQINLMTTLTGKGALSAQTAVSLYVALLDHHQWDEKTILPMIEQLARVMAQPGDVRLPAHALWHMVELTAQIKTEALCKGAVKRILTHIIQQDNDEQLVKDLLRLRKATQSQGAARLLMQAWWRDYTHAQPTAQLQRIEKALDGHRSLEDLRTSLTTFIGVRKQFATKSIQEWAADIGTAYRVLQALSGGFDPEHRGGGIDVQTIQRIIEASVADWQSDQKHVLATNLRELAELLPMMSDARTKPSLIRNDDALERQLMSGEHAPQSAVDVMKWMAGYLETAHKNGT